MHFNIFPSRYQFRRFVFFLLLPIFCFLHVRNAHASTSENALVEKLHDIKALVDAGVNYDEYSRQITGMILLSEKCKRVDPGCSRHYGKVAYLIDAKKAWAEKIQTDSEEMREIKERQIQIYWQIAFELLDQYDKKKGKK